MANEEAELAEEEPMGDQENIQSIDIQKNLEAMRKRMTSPKMGGKAG